MSPRFWRLTKLHTSPPGLSVHCLCLPSRRPQLQASDLGLSATSAVTRLLAPSRDAPDTPPPLGHILDSNRRAMSPIIRKESILQTYRLPPPKPAEQHFQTWISKLMVAAGDDPDRTGRSWGAWLWFLFWFLNPAYPLGSFFESGYIEKYSGWRIAKYIYLEIGFGVVAFGLFVDALAQKPRGTGEVLEMTVGTGASYCRSVFWFF